MIKALKKTLRRWEKQVTYRGTNRKCPVCEKSCKRFLENGEPPRKDSKCPFCQSLERHRLLWLYLQRETDLQEAPPNKALHVAPEAFFEKKMRPLIGKGYLSADLFGENVDVKMDICDIRYEDKHFDFILCSHVLEHVDDDLKAMREMHRVLSDDGIAFLLVPITTEKTFGDPTVKDPEERLRLFGQRDHVRRYGPDYPDRLRESGFKVTEVHASDFLSAEEIEKMAVTKAAGELYICRR